MKPQRPGYYVETWDSEKQEFTPQKGVRTGPWSKWGLRKAIRLLRAMGYSCDRGGPNNREFSDASVYIYRVPICKVRLS